MDPNFQVFRYKFDRKYYGRFEVPNHPGMTEYRFSIQGKNMPVGVPAGCNPRSQNIDRGLYRKVAASYRDKTDPTFILKSRGIQVLASRVTETVTPDGKECILDVVIPDHLGLVDGQHTHAIVCNEQEANPDQWVNVILHVQEDFDPILVGKIAAGRNSSIKLRQGDIIGHVGRFEAMQEVLKAKPYADFISYRMNDEGSDVARLVELMWVSNPALFVEDGPGKHPNWVVKKAQAILVNGYYSDDMDLVSKMDMVIPVLPQLVDLVLQLNEKVASILPKPRAASTPTESADGRPSAISIRSLCIQVKKVRPFTDPSVKEFHIYLRWHYMLMVISGVRRLLRLNKAKNEMEWVADWPTISRVMDMSLKDILNQISTQHKYDRGNHRDTATCPSLWTGIRSVPWEKLQKFTAANGIPPVE